MYFTNKDNRIIIRQPIVPRGGLGIFSMINNANSGTKCGSCGK